MPSRRLFFFFSEPPKQLWWPINCVGHNCQRKKLNKKKLISCLFFLKIVSTNKAQPAVFPESWFKILLSSENSRCCCGCFGCFFFFQISSDHINSDILLARIASEQNNKKKKKIDGKRNSLCLSAKCPFDPPPICWSWKNFFLFFLFF